MGPEALKAIGQAYDKAWRDIAGNFGDDPHELARTKLATALLCVACEESRDVEVLKNGALKRWLLPIASGNRPVTGIGVANLDKIGCVNAAVICVNVAVVCNWMR